jgi:hypothetical protein
VLNYLAATLDDPAGKARGLRFTPQNSGSGLYCVPGADKDRGRIGALCRSFQPAPPIPRDTAVADRGLLQQIGVRNG